MNKRTIGLIGVLTCCLLVLGACGNDKSAEVSSLKKQVSSLKAENSSLKSSSGSSSDESEASSSSETNTHGLNEDATTSSPDGSPLVSVKFTSVTKKFDSHGQSLVNSDMSELAISNQKSVQFTITYTNVGQSENFLPSLQDFAVYDSNGTAGEIVNQQEGQTEVSQGHSASSTFWVNFQNDTPVGSKVEVEWSPSDVDGSAIYELTVN